MIGVIIVSVAAALLGDAVINPDYRRAIRARLRARRVAKHRDRAALILADQRRAATAHDPARRHAELRLPHLRAELAAHQREHLVCIRAEAPSLRREHERSINLLTAEIARLEALLAEYP